MNKKVEDLPGCKAAWGKKKAKFINSYFENKAPKSVLGRRKAKEQIGRQKKLKMYSSEFTDV